MYKKYAIVRCVGDLREVNFKNPFIQYLPKNMVRNHIIRKLPLNISEVISLGNKGLDIQLPITGQELNDEEYMRTIIEAFNTKLLLFNINAIILSKELATYKKYFKSIVGEERFVQFLYIDKVIKKIINCINKELKDMNFVIIDGDNSKTRYIIDHIYEGINSLTIVTPKPEVYEDIIEKIYEETGLAVSVTNNSINQEIASDIIINCNKDNDKMFYCFDEGSYMVDFISSDDKIKNIMIKRSDINIITGVDMYVNHHLMSKDLFHGILLNENRLLRSMYQYGYKDNMSLRLNKIKNKYHVRIDKMYQRGEEILSEV